jgi:two-component system phosphate regulon sensor histidine kinase PhoR
MSAIFNTQGLLNALDEPCLLVERDRVRLANQAARDVLGDLREGIDVRLVLRHPIALEQILSARSGDVEVSGIGGPERPWIISVRPVGEGSLLVRLIDRSAVHAAEQMRVDFVANASHELRTPLATILGYAETIADEPDLGVEAHARFGSIIQAEARRMLRIVEDLMSLSRIEADRFVAPTDVVAVDELLRRAAGNASAFADLQQCSVTLDVTDDLPAVRGDRAQLLQLLDNLIANSLRYGCLQAGCTVSVAARSEGRNVVVTVSDTGEGIAREHLPRLTQRFYRVDEARSRDSGGTGLGLAIVKHIVERHRGTLEIRSEVGRGTDVIVRLPAR